jgi:hypothetical protein
MEGRTVPRSTTRPVDTDLLQVEVREGPPPALGLGPARPLRALAHALLALARAELAEREAVAETAKQTLSQS